MDIGIPAKAIQRYIEEQIFTLSGTEQPREEFSILLTGSRATGTHTSQSEEADYDNINELFSGKLGPMP